MFSLVRTSSYESQVKGTGEVLPEDRSKVGRERVESRHKDKK
jgi:hypothetical protein